MGNSSINDISTGTTVDSDRAQPSCGVDGATATLQRLGLTAAATLVERQQLAVDKWATAYAHFRFVTPAQVRAFEAKCWGEHKQVGSTTHTKNLVFTALKDYPTIPPKEALHALEAAQALKVFDTFEIAHIEWVVRVPDPILFGCITGCPDRFVIGSWGNDISVEELVGEWV